MHSRIFDVRDRNFPVDEWASESSISNERYEVDGADYFVVVHDENARVEDIEDFFTKYFPLASFKVIENKSGQTAIVEFVGKIDEIYAKWYECVKDAFSALDESMGTMAAFRVRNSLEEPFGLATKFYLEDWTGYTAPACEFLDWLKHLSKQNNGEPFKLYVGQVFDYHF